MTIKQMYEACLIELNKQEAPSILLEDFNYLANKAINLYINRKYNIYDVNQQSTDDLRVLKATAILDPIKANYEDALMQELTGATYEVNLPDDYLHILNCICVYQVKGGNYKCYNNNSYVRFGAKRLTSDMWGQVINNFYMKPSYKRPYYYIHNVNTSVELPTNPIVCAEDGTYLSGTDYNATVTTTTTLPPSGGGDTPTTTSYKVKIGAVSSLTELSSSRSDDVYTISGSKTLQCGQTSSNSTFIYVKLPNNSPLQVDNIYVGDTATDENIVNNISSLTEMAEFLQTPIISEYETSGYTTYLGYIMNGSSFSTFGSTPQNIFVKLSKTSS